MPFLLAEILNFQGSTHLSGVGSLSYLYIKNFLLDLILKILIINANGCFFCTE